MGRDTGPCMDWWKLTAIRIKKGPKALPGSREGFGQFWVGMM